MAETSHGVPIRQTAIVAALILSLSVVLPARADDEPPGGAAVANSEHAVTVGKAKLTWHLSPAASAKSPALVAAFKQATEAHLIGGDPLVTPKAKPETLPGGHLMLPLPVEFIHAMFVGAGGQTYCSDSTVATRTWAETNTVEDNR